MTRLLKISFADLWTAVDEASGEGQGAETLNLSPYGAMVAALVRKRGPELFGPLASPDCRGAVFVPLKVDLPKLPDLVNERVIRPATTVIQPPRTVVASDGGWHPGLLA